MSISDIMSALLKVSLEGSVMILAVILIRAVFMNKLPKKTFVFLWIMTAFVLLMPIRPQSPVSVFNFIESTTDPEQIQIDTDLIPLISLQSDIIDSSESNSESNIESYQNFQNDHTLNIPNTPEVKSDSENQITKITKVTAKTNTVPYVIFIIWITGFVGVAAYFLFSYRKWKSEFSQAVPCFEEFVCDFIGSMKISRKIRVLVSDRITSPLTYGTLKPVILLPKFLSNSSNDEMYFKCVLIHEFVHIKHFDAVKKFLFTLCLCIHWFNPVVWLMAACSDRDIELACDEEVIENLGEDMKKAYSLVLLEAYDSKRIMVFSGFSRYALEERICAIMKYRKSTILSIVLAVCVIIGTVAVFGSAKVNNEQKIANENLESDVTTSEENVKLLADSEKLIAEHKARVAAQEKAEAKLKAVIAAEHEADLAQLKAMLDGYIIQIQNLRIQREQYMTDIDSLLKAKTIFESDELEYKSLEEAIEISKEKCEKVQAQIAVYEEKIVSTTMSIATEQNKIMTLNQNNILLSFNKDQRDILIKMLNTMDYFTEVSGTLHYIDKKSSVKSVFNIILSDNVNEIKYFECSTDDRYSRTNIGLNGNSHSYGNDGENLTCSTSRIYLSNVDGSEPLESRMTYDDYDSTPSYMYRAEGIVLSTARTSLFPQEITFGFLYTNKDWSITGEKELFGRNCFVIDGRLSGEYGAKLDIDKFTMMVDKETGVILYLHGLDSKGENSFELKYDEFKYEAEKMDFEQILKDLRNTYYASLNVG